MTSPRSNKSERQGAAAAPPAKRRYEKPRLTDYGPVSKLTQTGSVTTMDTGSMFRPCL
jgi:hypothetical protein